MAVCFQAVSRVAEAPAVAVVAVLVAAPLGACTKRHERPVEPVAPRPGVSALVGRSYVVTRAGGELAATRAGGRVSPAELRELTADHRELGETSPRGR